jgi:hypothetical protein
MIEIGQDFIIYQTNFTKYSPEYMPICLREFVRNVLDEYNKKGINKSINIGSDNYIYERLKKDYQCDVDATSIEDFGYGINDTLFNTKYKCIGKKDGANFGFGSKLIGTKASKNGYLIRTIFEDPLENSLELRMYHVFSTHIYKNHPRKEDDFIVFKNVADEYESYKSENYPLEAFLYEYYKYEEDQFLNSEDVKTGTRITLLGELEEVLTRATKNYTPNFSERWFRSLNNRFSNIEFEVKVNIKSQENTHSYNLYGYEKCLKRAEEKDSSYQCIDKVSKLFSVFDSNGKTLFNYKVVGLLANNPEAGRSNIMGQSLTFIFDEGYSYYLPENNNAYFTYPMPIQVINSITIGVANRLLSMLVYIIPEKDIPIVPSANRLFLEYEESRQPILADFDLRKLGDCYDDFMSDEMDKALSKYRSSTLEANQKFIYKGLKKLDIPFINLNTYKESINGKEKATVNNKIDKSAFNQSSSKTNDSGTRTRLKKKVSREGCKFGQPNANNIDLYIPDFLDGANFASRQGKNSLEELKPGKDSLHIYFTRTKIYINKDSNLVNKKLKQIITLCNSNSNKNIDSEILFKSLVGLKILETTCIYIDSLCISNLSSKEWGSLACEWHESNCSSLDQILYSKEPFKYLLEGFSNMKL